MSHAELLKYPTKIDWPRSAKCRLSNSFTLVWQRVVVLIFTRTDTQVRSVVSGIPSSVLDAKIEHEQNNARVEQILMS